MEKVEEVIAAEIRPALLLDGGDIEVVEADDATGEVKVKLQGACAGCPFSQMTLAMTVEKRLMEQIPEVKKVTAV